MTIKYKENIVKLEFVTGEIKTFFDSDTNIVTHFELTVTETQTKGLLSQTYFILYENDCPWKLLERINKKVQLIKLLDGYTREMEGYSYYGSNPGVSVDDYEYIVEDIMKELKL